jgi:hypothetical protein
MKLFCNKNKKILIYRMNIFTKYFIVLNKGISRYLKYNGLYVYYLGSEELFKKLLHIWYGYYQQIQKHSKTIKLWQIILKPQKMLKQEYSMHL